MNSGQFHTISLSLVRELTTASQILAAQALRFTVWQSEGVAIHDPAHGVIADHHDDHSTHWGIFVGGRLVAAARLCLHHNLTDAPDAEMFMSVPIPLPVASMNRLVVLKSYRGQRLGGTLDRVRIQRAKELGARTVIATPVNVESRKESLRMQGFQSVSEVTGNAKWSPTVKISACYLLLRQSEEAVRD